MSNPYVKLDIHDRIGWIEFFHPKSNSLPSALLQNLTQTIQNASANDEVKVICIQAAGEGAFCAGASFDELLEINNEVDGKAFFLGFANVIAAIKNSSKPVVTLVKGKAIGGGVGIVAASDYVIAIDKADIKLSELSIGIGPFVIGPAVKRKVGLSKFAHITLNPKEWFSPDWAKNNGLYNEVVYTQEDLQSRGKQKLMELSGYTAQAIAEIKKMFWEQSSGLEKEMDVRAQQSGALVISNATKQILTNFKKK